MRPLPLVLASLLLLSVSNAGQAANLNQIFSKTLILGASVSSGEETTGPGTRAAHRYKGKVINRAEAEKPSTDYDEDFDEEYLAGFTSVIAIDFLFWDSSFLTSGASIKKFDELLEATEAKGIPLVIGDIPALLSWYKQMSRGSLNTHIRRNCTVARKCYLVQFEDLHTRANNGGILIKNKRYRFEELMEDELHMNAIGSEYVADMIVNLLK